MENTDPQPEKGQSKKDALPDHTEEQQATPPAQAGLTREDGVNAFLANQDKTNRPEDILYNNPDDVDNPEDIISG